MAGGFGRKGVVAGATADRDYLMGVGLQGAERPRVSAPPSKAPDDGLSPQARAFLAAERARSGELARVEPDQEEQAYASAPTLKPVKTGKEKSLLLAYVYWWFSGVIGAHRFYLGAWRSGLAMPGLFFGGLLVGYAVPMAGVAMIVACMGWVFVDAFLIPGLRRAHANAQRTGEMAYKYT